ncbi:DUF2505 domain-containing protein [Oryzobacter telluris]|uniref:DUF2505 domain-containing protein n=1 Tax=Oryzobacter telluris TaxID=3149179 RepID=UPI00370D5C0E
MRLQTREELAGTVDEVHALLTDQAFQEAKCAATTDDGTYTVDVSGSAPKQRVRTQRQLPSDGLPDIARSFVGEHLTIIEVIDWSGPAADGSREAVVDIHVKGAPLTIKGTLRLVPSGSGTAEVLDADLKANVPLIGGRLEKAAAEPITAAIGIEANLLREWLAR